MAKNKIIEQMQKIWKLYEKHTVGKVVITIAIVVCLLYCLMSIPVWRIGKEALSPTVSRQIQEGSQIAKQQGKIEIAESNGRILYLDTDKMILEVKDKESGQVFSSAVTQEGSEAALLNVAYLGEDNNLYEWNSYDNCTAFSSYEMYAIENGVRIDLDLNEGESNRFYEYLPKKMSIERYENLFKAGIEAAKQEGTLEEAKATRYMNTLSLVYKKSIKEECYAITYTGTPPSSAVNQMIEIAKLVGYTREMLLEDAQTYDFSVTFTENAQFNISVEATLEEGELVVHIPTGSIVNGNDYYMVQNIRLLPNFGAATATEYHEGYMLVPDGSGALISFNDYHANVGYYERPLYQNDYYSQWYYAPQYAEDLNMPVYGMLYGETGQTQKGFLAIVEEGARNGWIHARQASVGEDSSKYNKVYASFDVAQYKKVKINGEYSITSGTYLVNTGIQNLDLTVRYQFFGNKVTYYDFAKAYQDYLMKTEGIEPDYSQNEAKLYLEVIGGMQLAKRLVGIPYSVEDTMTTYDQLSQIMDSLGSMKYMLQYDGVFNGGMNGQMNNGASLVKSNGTKKELASLLNKAKELDVPIFLQTQLTEVYDEGNGFRPSRHAVRDYTDKEVEMSRYMPVLGIPVHMLNDGLNHKPYTYYQVSPAYLKEITDAFLQEAGEYTQLAVTDLADMYYADYRFHGFVSGETGNQVLEESLNQLSQDRSLALSNPQMDKIGYGSIAVDISRESSDYAAFAMTIPFRQLVMNGLTEYTTRDINLSDKSTDYYILQAAELGSYAKYTVTYENVDKLYNTDFHYIYRAQYQVLAEEIKAVYEECSNIRRQIGSVEIANHEYVQEGVYRTTYANGAQVTVNYNLYEVTLAGGTVLGAEDYCIRKGGEVR